MFVLAWLFFIWVIVVILAILSMTFISVKNFKIIQTNILTWLTVCAMIGSWSAIVCGLLWLGGKFF